MTALHLSPQPPLLFDWGVSSCYAWGLFGQYLTLHCPGALTTLPMVGSQIVLDPLRAELVGLAARAGAPLWEALRAAPDATLDAPLLVNVGNGLTRGNLLRGAPTVGVAVFEQPNLPRAGLEHLGEMAAVVTLSTWNAALLRAAGVRNVVTVFEGIDKSVFHPGPKINRFPGRFVVFAGGKLEHRKGQDIVLEVFRAFQQRHREALLLASWASPWGEEWAARFGGGKIPAKPDGSPDVIRWAVEGGIPASAIVALDIMPNLLLPYVIREADAALFCNRGEAGTNAVARECAACGVPVILSANTGHLDLLAQGIGAGLERQGVSDFDGWGETDVEEAVEALEAVYRGQPHAGSARALEWAGQIAELVGVVESVA